MIHKAEAIVGPTDLVPYLGAGTHAGRESQLAYHNNLMVQFWSSLASRDTRLMTHVLRNAFPRELPARLFRALYPLPRRHRLGHHRGGRSAGSPR